MGGCGNVRNQPCDDRWNDCFTRLATRYSFYLAIENSDCYDYVTEKVWNNALMAGMVPIVWSDRVDYKALLPPHSFINVADYATVADFAVALREIAAFPHLYHRYHEWRKSYRIEAEISNQAQIMCDYLSERVGQDIRMLATMACLICVIICIFGQDFLYVL